MKRKTLFLLGAVLLLGSACADPDSSILVTGHVPLEGSLDDMTMTVTDCQAPSEIGGTAISQDVFINLDEVADVGFQLGLLMENRLDDSAAYAPIGHDQNQRTDQNHIEIQGYEVVFDSGDKGFNTLGSDGDIRYEATGILPTDGVLWAGVTLFEGSNEVDNWKNALAIAADGKAGAIVPTFAEVQVVGRTVGGAKVESNKLTIPIQVCDGCARTSTPICVATK